MMYRYTRNDTFLVATKQLSDYFINHLPEDFIPYSDFEDPNIPNVSKDASAATIACSALFELARYTDNEKYSSAALNILESLINNYLSKNSIYHSILKRGCVRSGEAECGLVYANYYFLEAIQRYNKSITGIAEDDLVISDFILSQNHPNPFNPSTIISYSISVEQLAKSFYNVTLKLYDVLGKEVATIVNRKQKSGNYKIQFKASNLSSGIYYYTLRIGNFIETKKMILLR